MIMMNNILFTQIWLFVLVLHGKSRVVGNVFQPVDENLRSLDREGPAINAKTLRLVHAELRWNSCAANGPTCLLFRHGDRSQIRAYKNDIYTESDWPQGYGQLSTTGMQQEFELGQYFKQKYINTGFMNASYTREQLSVRSTNYDRTLMSASSVLAGLFPPAGDQVWNKDLPWQPIPVHTVPKDEDWLLHTDVPCPKYNEYADQYTAFIELRNKTVRDNWDLYQYMSQNAGEEPTWEGMGAVLDPIFCQYVSNKTLPAWVMVNNTLERLMNLTDVYPSAAFPPPVAYLKGGVLVGEMIEHMINKTVSPESQDKMYLYSAHDSTILAHLTTLGVFNSRKPQYTACVITELHEPSKGDYYVQILYKNETFPDRPPYVLKLKNCDSLCPLDRFYQIMKSSIPSDIKKECGLEETKTPLSMTSKEATVAIATLSSLILLLVVVGAILCCMLKRNIRDTSEYSLVPMEMS